MWFTEQQGKQVLSALADIQRRLQRIENKENQIMSVVTDQLDALEANAKAINGADDAAEAAFTKLAQMIADLKTNSTDPATAARIQAVSDELKARAAKLAAAVAATPQ